MIRPRGPFLQYLHVKASGRLRRTFREHIAAFNLRNRSQSVQSLDYPFLEFGQYYEQLLRYFELFPHENICVQLYDDYRAEPSRTLEAIFRFLGVDPAFAPDTSTRHMEARLPRRPGLMRWLRKLGAVHAVKKLIPRVLLPLARGAVFLSRERMTMSPEDRRFLVNYYAQDIGKLTGLLNRDLSAWLEPDQRSKKIMPVIAPNITATSAQESRLPKFRV